jgi:hypothetical protein
MYLQILQPHSFAGQRRCPAAFLINSNHQLQLSTGVSRW